MSAPSTSMGVAAAARREAMFADIAGHEETPRRPVEDAVDDSVRGEDAKVLEGHREELQAKAQHFIGDPCRCSRGTK